MSNNKDLLLVHTHIYSLMKKAGAITKIGIYYIFMSQTNLSVKVKLILRVT